MTALTTIAEGALARLSAKHRARERALDLSRQLIQHASRTIRAVHREEWDDARRILDEARAISETMHREAEDHPDIYFSGYAHDAWKELAEASLVFAIVAEQPLPSAAELRVTDAAYLNGLGEAAGELRRHALDLIRRGELAQCERTLGVMDEIYSVLVTVDFPDAVTGGLRRTTDMVRGVVERTRGDLTTAVRQDHLRTALEEIEARISGANRSGA
jgi:translin